MALTYLQEKLREALAMTQGDAVAAQKILVAWAVRDQTLLLGLTKAQLPALVKIALETMLNEKSGKASAAELPDEVLSRLMNQAGLRQAQTKLGPAAADLPDPNRQAETWAKIAAAFKKK
jgi:flagellar biogenesis protein FliO